MTVSFGIRLFVFYLTTNLAAVFALHAPAFADDNAAEETPNPYQFDLGGHAALGAEAMTCERNDDVHNCQTPTPIVGLNVGAQYRLASRFALGGLGSLSTVPGIDRYALLWRVTIDGRYYPIAFGSVDLWLSLEAGLVGVNASLAETRPFSEPGTVKEDLIGLGLGFGVGMDFDIVDRLALGFALRTLATFTTLSDRGYLGSYVDFNQAFWFMPAFNIRYRL